MNETFQVDVSSGGTISCPSCRGAENCAHLRYSILPDALQIFKKKGITVRQDQIDIIRDLPDQ